MSKIVSKKAVALLLILICAVVMTVPIGLNEKVDAKSKVRLNHKSITLIAGKSKKLKVKGTWRKVKWKSGNKSVAIVTKKGVVKAKKPGKCKIYAKVKGKKRMKCTVTVITKQVNYAKKLRNIILKKGKKISKNEKQIYNKTIDPYDSETIKKVWITANKKNNNLIFKSSININSGYIKEIVTMKLDLTKNKDGVLIIEKEERETYYKKLTGTIGKSYDGKKKGLSLKTITGWYETSEENGGIISGPIDEEDIKNSIEEINNAFENHNILLKKYGSTIKKIGFTKWNL